MLDGLLRLVFVLCMLAVVILAGANTIWFNNIPENHRFRAVLACNVLTLWITAMVLIIKVVVM